MPNFGSADARKQNQLLEKGMHYRFWRKAEERPRHASAIAENPDKPSVLGCQHKTTAYAGPPHAPLPRRIVCLECREWASEDELKERGEDFDTFRDWIAHQIMNDHAAARLKGRTGKFLFLPFGKTKPV